MKSLMFKFGIVSVLIVVGLLAVCALCFSKIFCELLRLAINPGELDLLASRPRNTDARRIVNGDTDVPEAQYHERLARIRRLLDQGKVEEIVKEGDEIQDIWAKGRGRKICEIDLGGAKQLWLQLV